MIWSDPREKMAKNLVRRGSATMDEILEANFGEWPPRGLEIIGKNDQVVQIMSIRELDREDYDGYPLYLRLWGMINIEDEGKAELAHGRKIGISKFLSFKNTLLGRSSLNSLLGHEGTHILQGDHYYRADEIFGTKNAEMVWAEQKNDTKSNMIAESLFLNHMEYNSLKAKVTWFVKNINGAIPSNS